MLCPWQIQKFLSGPSFDLRCFIGCPIEQTQAQIDGGRVQCIGRRIDTQPGLFRGVDIARSFDQTHGQRVIDTPIPLVQRVRKRGSGRYARQSHVKQLALVGRQAYLDVAQGLPLVA